MSGALGSGDSSLTALYLTNPDLATAIRRQQMGQQIAQGGLDYSPIRSPWQGLARVAQGLMGGLLMHGAQNHMDDAAKARSQDLAAALQRGNSLLAGGGAPPESTSQPSTPQPSTPQPSTPQPAIAAPAPQAPAPQMAPQNGTGAPAPAPSPYASVANTLPVLQAASARTGVPVPILASVLRVESSGNPQAVNPTSGATGLMGVLPSTAANPGYGVQPLARGDLVDPEKNINFAADYLAALGGARGLKDWSNPNQVVPVLSAYGGDSTPAYGTKVLAGAARFGTPPPGATPPGLTPPGATPQAAAPGAQPGGSPPGLTPSGPTPSGLPPPQGGATGLQSPSIQRAIALTQFAQQLRAQHPMDPAYEQIARGYEQQAQMVAQLDQWIKLPDGSYINARSGQPMWAPTGRGFTDANKNAWYLGPHGPQPLAPANPAQIQQNAASEAAGTAQGGNDWQQQPDGTWINRAAGGKPMFQPVPRTVTTPSGDTIAIGPGGRPQVIAPANDPAIGARKQAEAAGTATGEQTAKTAQAMMAQGKTADTAIGNIDYGLAQYGKLVGPGGIRGGALAPWLTSSLAYLQGRGLDVSKLGFDPNTVTNAQTASKTLGVVAGQILQQVIGKDSAITDAKVQHFIDTQPNLATDPQAIFKILNWARSQYAYQRDQAMDAMKHIDPKSGQLEPGWEARWYAERGAFAPVYNANSNEMQQPTGAGPSLTPPVTSQPPAPRPSPVQQPPVPGARRAPDNNWYVADPKRPGKFLRVDP